VAFRIKLLGLLTVVFLFAVPFCPAQTLEQMRSAAEKISSIKGDFIQEKQMPILARPLIARGYFAYQRPSSLRWEYQNPLQSILLLHNGNVHRYLKSDNQWVEDKSSNLKSMEFILQEISKWLNGRFEDNPMFNVSVETDKKIIMKPKDKSMDQFIRRIELMMADQPGLIKTVTIFENNDSFTRFTFIDPLVNAPIAPVEFQKIQ
jgi:outer membrane lipoprotein-sorting protein